LLNLAVAGTALTMSGQEALMLADISLTHVILTNSMEQNPPAFYKKLTVLQLARKFLAFFKIKIFTDVISTLGSCCRRRVVQCTGYKVSE